MSIHDVNIKRIVHKDGKNIRSLCVILSKIECI